MIYQRVHSATLAIAQQHERMMEEMEKSSQVHLTVSQPSRNISFCACNQQKSLNNFSLFFWTSHDVSSSVFT